MNAKHTPGPWLIADDDHKNFVYALNESGTNRFDLGIRRGYEFQSKSVGYGDRTPLEEIQANAHLIAAAPDLLESGEALLSMYVAMINSGDCGNWNPEEEKEVINLRAAISKAKGEKP